MHPSPSALKPQERAAETFKASIWSLQQMITILQEVGQCSQVGCPTGDVDAA